MSESLASYVDDHLAGARSAIDLLEVIEKRHEGDAFGRLAHELHLEIDEDRQVLRGIADRIGIDSNLVKETGAWLGEKFSRLTFRYGGSDAFGQFMALETLTLGILGKRALWQALREHAQNDVRLQGIDYDHLITRAESQYGRAENERLRRVHTALSDEREPEHR